MKTSKHIVDERILRAYKAILRGMPTSDITEIFIKDYGVTSRQIATYIAQARDLIKQTSESKKDLEYLVSESILRLDGLFYENHKKKNFPECRAIIESKAKLLGLYAATKTELTGKDGQPLNPITKIVNLEDFSEEEKIQLLSIARKIEK